MPTISLQKRVAVLREASLWTDPNTNRLRDGAIQHIKHKFNPISRTSIQRIIRVYRESQDGGILTPEVASRRKGNCGRKSKLTIDLRGEYSRIVQEYANRWIRLSLVTLQAELRRVGFALSTSTISGHLKTLHRRVKNLRIKPHLTQQQMDDRSAYVLNQVDRGHGLDRPNHLYKDFYDTIMIDESWFFMKRVNNQVWLLDDTVVPDAPTCQHKSHIEKVMFLVAVARPRTLADGTHFSGKIGLWPCTEVVIAKRDSKNRPAGTPEIKSRSVDCEFYQELFTKPGGVLAKIKERMPWLHGRLVRIQHDGARPHTGMNSEALIAAHGSTNGWQFRFKRQPAQSPDLNILDLGFFHALKSHAAKLKMDTHNIGQLVDKIRHAFNTYPPSKLDHVWGHFYACMNIILSVDGSNQYKPPHSGARARHIDGVTSVSRTVDVDNYNRVYAMFH